MVRISERDSLAFGQALRELPIGVAEPGGAGTGVRESLVEDGVAHVVNEVNGRLGSRVVRPGTGKAATRIRVIIE